MTDGLLSAPAVTQNYNGGITMKICPKCHLSFDDTAVSCAKCGDPLTYVDMQTEAQPPVTDHTAEFSPADISQNKVLAMVSYLMGWIGIIITLLAAGSSPYAGFHVRQALKIQVCSTLVTIVGAIIPFIGWIAAGIFAIAALVLNIICFFSVCKGEAKEPPFISSLTFLK